MTDMHGLKPNVWPNTPYNVTAQIRGDIREIVQREIEQVTIGTIGAETPAGAQEKVDTSAASLTAAIAAAKAELQTADALLAPLVHTHDDRYYLKAQVDASLAGKAAAVHSHNDLYYTEVEVDALIAGVSGGAGWTPVNATTTTKGIVELATTTEATTGTDTTRATTPAGVKAALDAKTVSDMSTYATKAELAVAGGAFVVTAGPVTLPDLSDGQTMFYRLTDTTTVNGIPFDAGRYGFEKTGTGWVWWLLMAATELPAGVTTTTTTAGVTTTTTTAGVTTTTTTAGVTTTTTTAGVTTTTTTAAEFPATLANVYAWYSASDAATIITGATMYWNDKSGNARHVSQTAAAAQPTTGARTLNGLNVLDFDGGDWLGRATSPTFEQPYTVAVVWAADALTAANQIPWSASSVWAGAIRSTGNWFIYSPNYLESATAADTTAHTTVTIFNGASSALRLDGVEIVAGNAGGNFFGGMVIGAATSAGAASINGAIAEVVVIEGVLAGADLTGLEDYLSAKWGTP